MGNDRSRRICRQFLRENSQNAHKLGRGAEPNSRFSTLRGREKQNRALRAAENMARYVLRIMRIGVIDNAPPNTSAKVLTKRRKFARALRRLDFKDCEIRYL